MATQKTVIDAAVVYDRAFLLQSIEAAAQAKANAEMSFFSVSIETISPGEEINLVVQHGEKLKTQGKRLTAVIVAVGDPDMERLLATQFRYKPGTAAVMTATSLKLQANKPEGAEVTLGLATKAYEEKIDARLAQLEERLGTIQMIQKAQGDMLQAATSELDDVRDEHRVTRDDLRETRSELSQRLRDVTGGNLGSADFPQSGITLSPPEERAGVDVPRLLVGAVSIIGALVMILTEWVIPDLMGEKVKTWMNRPKSSQPKMEANDL